jgi:hypothetical protein
MLRIRILLVMLSIYPLFWPSAFSRNTPAKPAVVSALAQSALSAALGKDLSIYHARRAHSGFVLENSRHALEVEFRPDGAVFHNGGDHWRMQLAGWGRGDTFEKADRVLPRSNRNRVEYSRAWGTEWYTNGPAGLEQGFTINRRPAGAGGEPLTVLLELSGNFANDSGRRSLALLNGAGTPALVYRGLNASDATGRDLPTWQGLEEGKLVLQVDDTAAVYPVTIDPWIQRAKLSASDGKSGDGLGSSVAIDGDTVVAGAPMAGNANQGAVYVFVKPASGWKNMTQVAKLTATDATFEDELGFGVDIQGDTIIAGAPVVGFNDKPGAVYVFVKPVTGWKDMTQTAKLIPSDGQTSDQLGWFVSLSGNTVVGGAPGAGSNSLGLVYVFTKPVTGWKKTMTETATLSASHGGGVSGWLSVDHDTVVAGGVTGNAKEAAFVYVRPAKGWKKTMTETAVLESSDGQPQDLFGTSTYVEGDTIVVGAPEAKIGSNSGQGAGYVFLKPAGGWKGLLTQTAKLTASDGQAKDQLGGSAAIFSNTLVLGANTAQVKGVPTGAVYLYVEPPGGWKDTTQKFKIVAKDGMGFDFFGNAVSISANTLAVGAPGATVHSQAAQGAAYGFENIK